MGERRAPPAAEVVPNDPRRRLVLATSVADPRHQCLCPVLPSLATGVTPVREELFYCACGEQFTARLELFGWSTEFEPRCLRKLSTHLDERKVPG